MWLFEHPTSYSEMCKKIAQSVFFISLIEIFLLAQISPDFAQMLKKLSFNTETELLNIKLYISYIYIPLILSLLENIFKMHDVIGKLFGIRIRNAATVIFPTYIIELNIKTSKSKKEIQKAYTNNKSLQYEVGNHFYRHVSYSDPLIDKHEVSMALDAWTWFWISLDTFCITLVFLLGVVAFNIFGALKSCLLIVGLCFYLFGVALIGYLVLKIRCSRYTKREIRAAIKYDQENNKGTLNNNLKEKINDALSC